MFDGAKVTLSLNDFDELRDYKDSYMKLGRKISDSCEIDFSDYEEKQAKFKKDFENFIKIAEKKFPEVDEYRIIVNVDLKKLEEVIKEFCTFYKDEEIPDEDSIIINYIE